MILRFWRCIQNDTFPFVKPADKDRPEMPRLRRSTKESGLWIRKAAELAISAVDLANHVSEDVRKHRNVERLNLKWKCFDPTNLQVSRCFTGQKNHSIANQRTEFVMPFGVNDLGKRFLSDDIQATSFGTQTGIRLTFLFHSFQTGDHTENGEFGYDSFSCDADKPGKLTKQPSLTYSFRWQPPHVGKHEWDRAGNGKMITLAGVEPSASCSLGRRLVPGTRPKDEWNFCHCPLEFINASISIPPYTEKMRKER